MDAKLETPIYITLRKMNGLPEMASRAAEESKILFIKNFFGRFYYLIFQTGASRQNLIKPRLSAFVSCKINDLV